jgi:hypothetical protein
MLNKAMNKKNKSEIWTLIYSILRNYYKEILNKTRSNREIINVQIVCYHWVLEELSISYYKDILNNNRIRNLLNVTRQGKYSGFIPGFQLYLKDCNLSSHTIGIEPVNFAQTVAIIITIFFYDFVISIILGAINPSSNIEILHGLNLLELTFLWLSYTSEGAVYLKHPRSLKYISPKLSIYQKSVKLHGHV